MSKIAVAVSGGADSLYALVRLHEMGHELIAIHGLFLAGETDDNALELLEKLCSLRCIPLHIIDFRSAFDQEVILPFLHDYALGITPNPCALCNAKIKFGLLMDSALALGAELFATGHYAALNIEDTMDDVTKSPLSKGLDMHKDQSYFLALVARERLLSCLFPLAHTQKTENISYLKQHNIIAPIAKESQEICFVPDIHSSAYRNFVLEEAKKRQIHLGKGGNMYVRTAETELLVPEKQGGKHGGLWQYTEGQRRGLGVAWSEPLYVCEKDKNRNALILASQKDAVLNACTVERLNFFVQPKFWPWDNLLVRLRYRQKEVAAHVIYDNNMLFIQFSKPQPLTAPGQVAVIYNEQGHVLAGGIISSVR